MHQIQREIQLVVVHQPYFRRFAKGGYKQRPVYQYHW